MYKKVLPQNLAKLMPSLCRINGKLNNPITSLLDRTDNPKLAQGWNSRIAGYELTALQYPYEKYLLFENYLYKRNSYEYEIFHK